jgi:hypothetical protein
MVTHSAVKTMITFSIIPFLVSAAVTFPTPCQQPVICSHHSTFSYLSFADR